MGEGGGMTHNEHGIALLYMYPSTYMSSTVAHPSLCFAFKEGLKLSRL